MKILDIPQSGKIGTLVSYKHGSVQCQRTYVLPRDARTRDQMARRDAMKRLRLLWGTLTDRQYAAWDAVARSKRTARRLNQSGRLNAYNLFIKINFNLATIGLPPVLEPPEAPLFGDNPVVELTITKPNGALALQLVLSEEPAQYVLVLGTKPLSAGSTYADHFTLLGVVPAPDHGVSDITAMFVAKFGPPPAGSRVFIETQQQINGWKDLPHRFNARVP